MKPTAPFLLFDLGGVLIENAGFERLSGLLDVPLSKAEAQRRWLASPAVRAFELGRIDADAFARSFVEEWRPACTADQFLAAFATWPKDFFPGALALLATLRASHRIGCLSNSNALHWARYDGFANRFDVTLSSHRIGLIKPDADCFAHAAAACGEPPERIAFFDDSLPNVLAARAAGMRAWQVDGLTETRAAVAAALSGESGAARRRAGPA